MSQLNHSRNETLYEVVDPANAPSHFPTLWLDGSSAIITQLRGQIRRVAPYFRTALIVGESGCGEDAAAHILHKLSPLNQRPFVDLCSGHASQPLTEETLAAAGMVYISHPEQLSPSLQATLVRILRRHGPLAPRLVACAQRSLRPLVTASGFSSDLADYLGALRIVIPPLRERRQDIPQLLIHILQELAARSGARVPELAPDLVDAALLLPWRGNLVQLLSAAEGLMERAAHLILHAPDLDAVLGAISDPTSAYHREVRMIRLDDVIQEHIRAVLYACNGNKLRSAEVLGISRSTLYRMLEIPVHSVPKSLAAAGMQMSC